jgi:hypothetical protein
VPTLMSASQFIDDTSFSASGLADVFAGLEASTPISTDPLPVEPVGSSSMGGAFASLFSEEDMAGLSSSHVSLQPIPVENPIPPKRIDISFMQPDMVLVPADLSAFREQNPYVQLTPDQWRILTLVDGQRSLQLICQQLGTHAEIVCTVAGELVAEGLIHVAMPGPNNMRELSPVARELAASGLSNGYVAPGYISSAASPWSASLPAVAPPIVSISYGPDSVLQQLSPMMPAETESQWGNGGNGATFVPGRGWVMLPQPPMMPNGQMPSSNGVYA